MRRPADPDQLFADLNRRPTLWRIPDAFIDSASLLNWGLLYPYTRWCYPSRSSTIMPVPSLTSRSGDASAILSGIFHRSSRTSPAWIALQSGGREKVAVHTDKPACASNAAHLRRVASAEAACALPDSPVVPSAREKKNASPCTRPDGETRIRGISFSASMQGSIQMRISLSFAVSRASANGSIPNASATGLESRGERGVDLGSSPANASIADTSNVTIRQTLSPAGRSIANVLRVAGLTSALASQATAAASSKDCCEKTGCGKALCGNVVCGYGGSHWGSSVGRNPGARRCRVFCS